MSATVRNNVRVSGHGSKAMVFAHGFGCDQNMWRYMAPPFEENYRVILFDHVGAGRPTRRPTTRPSTAPLTDTRGTFSTSVKSWAWKMSSSSGIR
jgi:pimeloyl-ACP methyl ester carboxylesterase